MTSKVKPFYPILIAALASPLFATENPPVLQGLGDLPGGIVRSVANGVSADGTTVGGHSGSESSAAVIDSEAFRWREDEGMVPLGYLSFSRAHSITTALSGDGTALAGLAAKGTATTRAFRQEGNDDITSLGAFLGSGFAISEGNGISDDGTQVVGSSRTSEGFRAFLWNETDGMVDLGFVQAGTLSTNSIAKGISGNGLVVVGSSTFQNGIPGEEPIDPPTITDIGTEAFIWDEVNGMNGLGDLPGGEPDSQSLAASFDGSVIVGYGSPSSGGNEGVIWNNGIISSVGDLAGGETNCRLTDVTADGTIAVGFGNDEDGQTAVVWDAQNGLRKLSYALVLAGVEKTGWTFTEVVGISADGDVIVGNGTNPSGDPEAWRMTGALALLVPPEPVAPTVSVSIGWSLQFSTEADKLYQAQSSFNLGNWSPLGDPHSTAYAAGPSSFAVADPDTASTAKYYRVRTLTGLTTDAPTDLTLALGSVIGFETLPGFVYQTQYSEDLQTWTNLDSPISTVGNEASIQHAVFHPLEDNPCPNPADCHYRVTVELP